MKRNVETSSDSELNLVHPVTLQKATDELALENSLLNTMRQLEGFPSSYQLKMAVDIHVLQQEFGDILTEKASGFGPEGLDSPLSVIPANQKAMASYGILGNLVGAALFNEAQCLLVKMQNNKNSAEI